MILYRGYRKGAQGGCSTVLAFVGAGLFIAFCLLGLAAEEWIAAQRPFAPTPLAAAGMSPQYRPWGGSAPTQAPDPQAQILAQQDVGQGRRALLYRYSRATTPGASSYVVPLTVAPARRGLVSRLLGNDDAWRFQAAVGGSVLIDRFQAGSVPAGFLDNGGYAVAWGVSGVGESARITWSDSTTTVTKIQNGAFLQARPDVGYPGNVGRGNTGGCPGDMRLSVSRVDVLDASHNLIETREFPTPSCLRLPEVR